MNFKSEVMRKGNKEGVAGDRLQKFARSDSVTLRGSP